MAELREKVEFPLNVPREVVLQYGDGVEQNGRYGPQFRWSLEGDKIMWVDPAVDEQLHKLGAKPGAAFLITKRELKQGARRATSWSVERAAKENTATGGAPAVNVSATPATEPTKNAVQPQANTGEPVSSFGLEAALSAAIIAAQKAEKYAADHNYSLRFTAEDIRAFANTLLIGAQQRGRL
jgi:pyruvate/2-oxoglutarate dehydrogenase complex dihydrolipoamide acyltransferase (E2) component